MKRGRNRKTKDSVKCSLFFPGPATNRRHISRDHPRFVRFTGVSILPLQVASPWEIGDPATPDRGIAGYISVERSTIYCVYVYACYVGVGTWGTAQESGFKSSFGYHSFHHFSPCFWPRCTLHHSSPDLFLQSLCLSISFLPIPSFNLTQ